MVAGQDAQTTGVLGKHSGDAELGGEVGDRARRLSGGELVLVPAVLREVPVEVSGGLLHALDQLAVSGELGQSLPVEGAEQGDGVVAELLPGGGVQVAEERLGLGVPGPAEVRGQTAQARDLLGQVGTDDESADCLHTATVLGDGVQEVSFRRMTLRGLAHVRELA